MTIVRAFQAVSNQWQIVPLGGGRLYWQGLDYARARAGLKQAKIKLNAAQWSWLRVMESAAASALNGYRG